MWRETERKGGGGLGEKVGRNRDEKPREGEERRTSTVLDERTGLLIILV